MSFIYKRAIPPLEEILRATSVSPELSAVKKKRDKLVADVISGKSDKFLVIVGPCSADNEDAVCDYVSRLAKAQDELSERLLIVPRVYTNKPRTTGEGYKGMLHQPNPEEAPNILEGIYSIRRTHLRVIAETGLTAADEMLYPDNYVYVEDILSYVAIGARSVENQQHRLVCSGFSVPSGMKNPTSGDLSVMFNAIYAAQSSHTFIYYGHEVETDGNPLAHAIMRGSTNKHGESIPNYHYEDIVRAAELYEARGLANPAIIIDTNHANSGKNYLEQPRIAKEILHSRRYDASVRAMVKGLLIESYIEEGAQKVNGGVYGQSITDGCLSWEQTEKLLFQIADGC
ncbi:MAG: 3-deoxy-7-phosphoheptulonate synthase [Clostridiales bacterium]|jgi:3-deoxy-7-phosphoheptulonate synthase|nr:3-deoxy-7-phosphoheptulonate synthase [Clostridiales bacterium]